MSTRCWPSSSRTTKPISPRRAGRFPARQTCWSASRSAGPGSRSAPTSASLSRKLLQELGLSGHFAAIAGRDTFPVSKPDPGHLTGTIALAGGDPSRALMVGDSEFDFAAAHAAGVPIVLARFGYGPLPQCNNGGAASMIDHLRELEALAGPLLRRAAAARSGRLAKIPPKINLTSTRPLSTNSHSRKAIWVSRDGKRT